MRLKRVLFDKGISQIKVVVEARKLGHRLDPPKMSLLVSGYTDSAAIIRATKAALLQLGISLKEINAIEELKGARIEN